jgi:hypothetical protein
MIRFSISGTVKEAETGLGLEGLFVKAYDKDLLFDDLLGTALTGPQGEFEIVSQAEDFREFFQTKPDLYLRIFTHDQGRELYSTEDAVRWRAGGYERFEVLIPRERLGEHAPPREVRLLGDDEEARSRFQPGESLRLHARGVRPSTPHTVTVAAEQGEELFTATLLSDAAGEIPPTVVWPLMGLEDPTHIEPLSIEEALDRWHDRALSVTVRDGEEAVAEIALHFDARAGRPLVLASDGNGRLLSGFVAGERDVRVLLHNAPEWEQARIYLVPRQHEWHPGDPIGPVELADGRLAQVDIDLNSVAGDVLVANANDVRPGAYDFIVRRLRYGYQDDDDLFLRPDDLIGGRTVTGLVVREEFMASKVIRGGCVNILDMVGRYIGIWPYMQFTDTFQIGENVWGALDPHALDPTLISKMVAIYVVPHKTSAQWSADPSLSNLAVLGGNPGTPRWLTQSWCINANLRLLWPGANQLGEYDVVADFGNNTGSAATFVQDDTFNPPLDIIDGYITPGFRVVADPTTDTSFANAGSYMYNETTQGYVDVIDDWGSSWHVPLKAVVYFPADIAGATSPSQISAVQPNFPLFVAVHGNGPLGGYLGYNYLLEHLAKNGFIAASIHLEPGETGTDRARVLRRHLQILFGQFGSHVSNNIGLMGHSRGGEAVVIATRLNQQEGWGYAIHGVISLAPTNQYTSENFGGAWAQPYLVIYGSLDGDLAGISDTGFELYDHATGMEKSLVFVYRACHDRFNTVWGDGDLYFGKLTPADRARVVSADAHHKIAQGYMAAFLRSHLRSEPGWEGMFRGEWVPAAVQAADPTMKIYVQYEDTTVRTVDNFEGAHTPTSWQISTLGGAVAQTGLPTPPQEDNLRTLDAQSPHATAGLLLKWDDVADSLRYDLPAGQRDASGFEALSFRIGQRVDSASNPASQAQDLRVTLTDGGGTSRAIRVSKLAEIPYPDVRGYNVYTKSAMRTVRIPMRSYTIRCLGVPEVDITNVVSITFEFAEKATGEIEIDSLQFTN